jgi:hypothetical protein
MSRPPCPANVRGPAVSGGFWRCLTGPNGVLLSPASSAFLPCLQGKSEVGNFRLRNRRSGVRISPGALRKPW